MPDSKQDNSRRSFVAGAAVLSAAALFTAKDILSEPLDMIAEEQSSQEVLQSFSLDKSDTAVVFIDPQNDVLSEKGLAWPLVHESPKENNTIENMERIFKAAKSHGFEVFIYPHYFFLWTRVGSSTVLLRKMSCFCSHGRNW